MSWMQKLYETYEQCTRSESLRHGALPAPPCHIIQQAHIEIVLDGNGKFRRAQVIEKEDTVIPATEQSATARTSAVVPHPLCDHIKYCAADYTEDGNETNEYFKEYCSELKKWCESPHAHPKATAILSYVERGSVLRDLIKEGVVPVDADGHLLTRWESKQEKPKLFRQLTKDPKTKEYKPKNALIRWIVESDKIPEVWKDRTLQDAWASYSATKEFSQGLCMVTGVKRVLADKHPKGMRGGKDGAKLISYKKEEDSDFIYLGRFLSAAQVVGIGLDVTQKAHSALRWLIERQGYRNGDQVVVTWTVSGKSLPDPFANSAHMFGLEATKEVETPAYQGDAGQAFAVRLNRHIAGYRAELGSTDEIVIMALDSATPGRMAITYYRELTGSEFLERIQAWHESCAWQQHYGRIFKFVGAPSPNDIAVAAYGNQLEGKSGEKLLKATVERLIPCIIDSCPVPRDLVESAVRRAEKRAGHDEWKPDKQLRMKVNEWEKNMGIACALFRGHHKEREYQMALELDRKTRDYLFGRLLAVAEHLEERALYVAGEKGRLTNAAKLMQRFADRPFSTWRTIELALTPYKTRLRAKWPSVLKRLEVLLDEIVCSLKVQDFMDDHRLSGEFLLGYHCQRPALWAPQNSESDEETTENQTVQGE